MRATGCDMMMGFINKIIHFATSIPPKPPTQSMPLPSPSPSDACVIQEVFFYFLILF